MLTIPNSATPRAASIPDNRRGESRICIIRYSHSAGSSSRGTDQSMRPVTSHRILLQKTLQDSLSEPPSPSGGPDDAQPDPHSAHCADRTGEAGYV